MYAPKVMNTLWPKLRTSIRPNTSVRPDAVMKTIMPIARPATVSVSQVDVEPTKGQAASASAAMMSKGRESNRALGMASWPDASAEAMSETETLLMLRPKCY